MSGPVSITIFGAFMLVLIVIVPIVVGGLLIAYSRRRGENFPSCGGCGYDVTGTVGAATRCPECGKDFVAVGILPPGGRRNPVMLWSGILIMLIPVTCVGFGLVLSMVSAQRMVVSQKAAVIAQQQAAAVQQAQANAIFPIPSPLTDGQITVMSVEQASAAIGGASAALNRTDLTDDQRNRLQHELALLSQQTAAADSHPANREPFEPLTDDQINAMSIEQSQSALTRVAVARRHAENAQDKDRLRSEFEKLLNHISELKGNGPITSRPPPATSPASKNLPPPLTNEQIDRMTLAEAQAALTSVSVARRQASATPEEKTRLKAEFERLLRRINTFKSGS